MRIFIKRLLIPALCLLWTLSSTAQEGIVPYDMGYYISFYSPALKNPLYVTYHLYKGGGSFDRSSLSFRKCGQEVASSSDYTYSGSNRGHLVPAQDFAFSREAMAQTFCMCNILPQTHELNHGDWLSTEAWARAVSQRHHLFIIAGAVFGPATLRAEGKVYIPAACYKVIYDTDEHRRIFCGWFRNDDQGKCEPIQYDELCSRIHYNIDTRTADFSN